MTTGRKSRMHRSAGALAVGLLLAGLASGCATAQPCVDWVLYDDEDARVAESDLVADVEVLDRDGTQSLYGEDVTVWRADVIEVVSAEGGTLAAAGDEIRIISTPETCSEGSPYPEGDPLDVDGVVRVYLDASGSDDGTLSLITPFQGVGPLDG